MDSTINKIRRQATESEMEFNSNADALHKSITKSESITKARLGDLTSMVQTQVKELKNTNASLRKSGSHHRIALQDLEQRLDRKTDALIDRVREYEDGEITNFAMTALSDTTANNLMKITETTADAIEEIFTARVVVLSEIQHTDTVHDCNEMNKCKARFFVKYIGRAIVKKALIY
jgi:hypothetical protein